ncbi:MAG: class I SAM-dependent methyltransferase, partial [Chromatocurvus sp.]
FRSQTLAASATALPLADASLGSVAANCVLEHVPRLGTALAEIHRVLRPGGRLVFGVPSHHFADMLFGSTALRRLGLKRLSRAYGAWFNRHSAHFHADSPQCWLARLGQYGFETEHWEYYISAAGLRAFDLAHYLGVPRLISYRLTGRWVAVPVPGVNYAYERWLRPYYDEPAPEEGAYLFFHARKPTGADTAGDR